MLERYYREMLRLLSRQLNDCDTAAELAQKGFVRVLTAQSFNQAELDMPART